jgi:hypothetical protein
MRRRWARAFGGASLLGGVLTVLVSVPPAWYGLEPRDSYVFDPPVSSPLWINRHLVPVLAVLAAIGLGLGLLGLARRDWPVAGRARRWGGVGGVLAFVGITVAVFVLLSPSGNAGSDVVVTLAGFGVGVLGLVLLVPAVILLAYGYRRTDRPHLGTAFAGALVAVPVLGYVVPGPTSGLVASLPVGVAWAVFGVDLLEHPDPLPTGNGHPRAANASPES